MNFAAEIKSAVSMADVCQYYGIEVSRSGFARCPLHGEKTGSMKVYPGERGFCCFGCHQAGSVIDFVMAYSGLDFHGAERLLNDAFHLGLPIDCELTDDQRREAEQKAKEQKRKANAKKERHRRLLTAYDRALTEWVRLDSIVSQKAPDGPLDAPDAEWIDAVRKIDAAAQKLSQTEMELAEFERSAG